MLKDTSTKQALTKRQPSVKNHPSLGKNWNISTVKETQIAKAGPKGILSRRHRVE